MNKLEWFSIFSLRSSIFNDLSDDLGAAVYIRDPRYLDILDCCFVNCTSKLYISVGALKASGGSIFAKVLYCSIFRVYFEECSGTKLGSSFFIYSSSGKNYMKLQQASSTKPSGLSDFATDVISSYYSELNLSQTNPNKITNLVEARDGPERFALKYVLFSSTGQCQTAFVLSLSGKEYNIDSIVLKGFRDANPMLYCYWDQAVLTNIHVINCTGVLNGGNSGGTVLFKDSLLGDQMETGIGFQSGSNVTMTDGVDILGKMDFGVPFVTKCHCQNSLIKKIPLCTICGINLFFS